MTSQRTIRNGAVLKSFLCAAPALAALVLAPSVAQAAGRDDIVMLIDPAGFGQLDINNFPLGTTVTGGVVSLQTDNVNCVATLGHPCFYVLNAIRISLSNFTFSGQQVNDSIVVVNGPLAVQDEGEGIIVPPGTPVVFAFTQGGNRQSVNSTSPSGMALQLNVATQHMSMVGSFSGSQSGVTVDAAVVANAISPFANLPPVAHAGPDQTVTCGAATHLDGSASTDPENNTFLYSWSENGNAFALGPTVTFQLPPGTHTITLTVIDQFGGQGTDTVVVTVVPDTTPPTFSSVPGALTISSCNSPNIGTASATDNCGGTVTITSNAPAVFPLGDTTVTYTARDAAGNTATATQVVTAILGDDPSCCPAGTNIILGTSNNDVLTGTAGSDCILGRGAQDTINGLGGNDFISGGDGDDVIDGGAGKDVIFAGSGQDHVTGGPGNDTIYGQDGDDTINGDEGDDVLFGGQGQDHLFGDAGNDQLFGEIGDDDLHGGDGNDLLVGGGLHDRCFPGAGVNTTQTCERVLSGP